MDIKIKFINSLFLIDFLLILKFISHKKGYLIMNANKEQQFENLNYTSIVSNPKLKA